MLLHSRCFRVRRSLDESAICEIDSAARSGIVGKQPRINVAVRDMDFFHTLINCIILLSVLDVVHISLLPVNVWYAG